MLDDTDMGTNMMSVGPLDGVPSERKFVRVKFTVSADTPEHGSA